MGRKKSTCSQYYDMTRDEQAKCEKARCKFCGWVSAKNTVRMKVHLVRNCAECPEHIKAEFAAQLDDAESESSSEESEETASETVAHESARPTDKGKRRSGTATHKSQRRKKRRRVASDRTTLLQEEHQEIDRALADYLFSANLPLSTLENPYFVTLCKKLRPNYTLPTRHRVVSQGFIQGASPVAQQMAYYSPLNSEQNNLASTSGSSGGLVLPLVTGPGTHQVAGVLSSPEQQQQPGTYHIVRIGNP